MDRFGVIYAGAQKHRSSGLVSGYREARLLDRARSDIPAMLSWKIAADNDSMYNTPPTFALYLSGLVFEWIEAKGGLAAMKALNEKRRQRFMPLSMTVPFITILWTSDIVR